MKMLNLLRSSLRKLTTSHSIAALRTTSRLLPPSPHLEPRPSEVLLRSFSTLAPQKFRRVRIEPSLDMSVAVAKDNGQRHYPYGMLTYEIIEEELIDMDYIVKYQMLVKKLGYLSMRTLTMKAADPQSHSELLNDSKEGMEKDLQVALILIGSNLVGFEIRWYAFKPLESLEENAQLEYLLENSDGTVKGLAFLFRCLLRSGGIWVVDQHISKRYIYAYMKVSYLVANMYQFTKGQNMNQFTKGQNMYQFTKGQSMTANQHMTVIDPNILSKCSRYSLLHSVAIGVVMYERGNSMSKKYLLADYDTAVAELTYAVINALMRPSHSSHAGLTEITMEHEELKQHLTEALQLLGLELVYFNFGWESFQLHHFDFELDDYYEPLALKLHAEEVKPLLDAARGSGNNLWEITFEALLDKLPDLWQPETQEGDHIKLTLELALIAALALRKKIRQDELEKVEAADGGFDPSHIFTVMTRAVRTKRDAVAALKLYGDMVTTILKLTGRDRE